MELETAKIRRLQAEHVAHEKAAAEQRALQRIKALEGSVSTLQAQKDQMARLNEQLMRQKASMEERLRDTKVSSFAHGPQQQDIVFYKNKVRGKVCVRGDHSFCESTRICCCASLCAVAVHRAAAGECAPAAGGENGSPAGGPS